MIKIILLLSFLSNVLTYEIKDSFTEELFIKPLYSEQLYVHFQFVTKWDIEPKTENFCHTRLFPRAIGEIIQRFNVHELHVSLTNGLWRYEKWGYPVIDAAAGAEVWAWFKPDTTDVDQNWKLLTNTLSGLLCASFNFVDETNSISPEFSFQPKGVNDWPKVNNTYLRYASLPREIVCTENLTPFKKLLPCGSNGIASLLNSGYIHNTRYHSLSVNLRPVCRTDNCDSISIELQQSVQLVYDYAILGTKNWNFKKLFGLGLNGKCPLATESNVYVDLTSQDSQKFDIQPRPDNVLTSFRGGQVNTIAKYTMPPDFFSISAKFEENNVALNVPPPIYANRYTIGYGQEKGGFVTKIYNNHWTSLDVVVLQNIPWYVLVYLHTLKVTSNGAEIQPRAMRYSQGRQRERPYYLELLLTLPPRSTTSIVFDFDYIFLKWQEYPPDANHGFYISFAVVSCYLPLARNFTGLPQDGAMISDMFNASRSGYLVQVRTEPIVVTLPTPDFSMPYNVICLVCTVVALAFGPLHNITTKRLVLKIKNNEKLLVRLKNKVMDLVRK